MDWQPDPIDDLLNASSHDLDFFFDDRQQAVESELELSIQDAFEPADCSKMHMEAIDNQQVPARIEPEPALSVLGQVELSQKVDSADEHRPKQILNELGQDQVSSEFLEKLHLKYCNRDEAASYEDLIRKSASRREAVAFDQASLVQAVKAYSLADMLLKISSQFDQSANVVHFGDTVLAVAHNSDKKIAVEIEKSKKKRVTLSQDESHGYIRFHRPESEYRNRLGQMTPYVVHMSQKKGLDLLVDVMKRIGVATKLEVVEVEIESQRFASEQEGRQLRLFTIAQDSAPELFAEALYFVRPTAEPVLAYAVVSLMAPRLYSALRKEISQKHLNETAEYLKTVKLYCQSQPAESQPSQQPMPAGGSRCSPSSLKEVLARKDDQGLASFGSLFGQSTLHLIEQLEELFSRHAKINSVRLEEILRRTDFFYFEAGIKQLVLGMYRLMLEYTQRLKTHELLVVRYRRDEETFQSCLLLESKVSGLRSAPVTIEYPEMEMLLFAEAVHALSLVFEQILDKVSMKGLLRLLKESEYPGSSVLKSESLQPKQAKSKSYAELVPAGFASHKPLDAATQQLSANVHQKVSSKIQVRAVEPEVKGFQPVRRDPLPKSRQTAADLSKAQKSSQDNLVAQKGLQPTHNLGIVQKPAAHSLLQQKQDIRVSQARDTVQDGRRGYLSCYRGTEAKAAGGNRYGNARPVQADLDTRNTHAFLGKRRPLDARDKESEGWSSANKPRPQEMVGLKATRRNHSSSSSASVSDSSSSSPDENQRQAVADEQMTVETISSSTERADLSSYDQSEPTDHQEDTESALSSQILSADSTRKLGVLICASRAPINTPKQELVRHQNSLIEDISVTNGSAVYQGTSRRSDSDTNYKHNSTLHMSDEPSEARQINQAREGLVRPCRAEPEDVISLSDDSSLSKSSENMPAGRIVAPMQDEAVDETSSDSRLTSELDDTVPYEDDDGRISINTTIDRGQTLQNKQTSLLNTHSSQLLSKKTASRSSPNTTAGRQLQARAAPDLDSDDDSSDSSVEMIDLRSQPVDARPPQGLRESTLVMTSKYEQAVDRQNWTRAGLHQPRPGFTGAQTAHEVHESDLRVAASKKPQSQVEKGSHRITTELVNKVVSTDNRATFGASNNAPSQRGAQRTYLPRSVGQQTAGALVTEEIESDFGQMAPMGNFYASPSYAFSKRNVPRRVELQPDAKRVSAEQKPARDTSLASSSWRKMPEKTRHSERQKAVHSRQTAAFQGKTAPGKLKPEWPTSIIFKNPNAHRKT